MLSDAIFKKVLVLEKEVEKVLGKMLDVKKDIDSETDSDILLELKDEYKKYGKKLLELEDHLNLLKSSKHYSGDVRDRTFME